MINKEHKKDAAELASEAAFELEIARETRGFLQEISLQKAKPASFRPLYLVSIAASLLILVASIVTINISHSDDSLASKYGINSLVSRSGIDVKNDEIRKAVQAYYAMDYAEARAQLDLLETSDKNLRNHEDWLLLLIELQTSGSKSASFNKQLDAIVSDKNHEFHLASLKLKKDVTMFWKRFVFKK